MKNIIVIYLGSIYRVPPVQSLLNALGGSNNRTSLIITKGGINADDEIRKHISVHELDIEYNNDIPITSKILRTYKLRKKLWTKIDSLYNNNSILWIISDVTLKNLGKKLLSYQYILHLYELVEKTYMIPKFKFYDINVQKYAQHALRVVVPEYNRAHITKAWWGLSEIPFIIENKPYYPEIPRVKDQNITHSPIADSIIKKLHDKKIILYQGILHKERPLDNFIHAVNKLGDEYAFVVMSNGENIYKEIDSSNYFFIPFVKAPYHLEITSHAYIGVLSYVPTHTTDYSILNAVYCAPNKTFEYSCFGVPMISNDIPGLHYLFDSYKCGKCVDLNNIGMIAQCIKEIDQDYDEFSRNSFRFYDSVDYLDRIRQLISEITK